MRNLIAALTVMLAGATSAFADEPMRCGSGFITSANSVAELLAKCGEPAEKQSRTEDVRGSGYHGMVKLGTTVIETWVYRRSRQSIPQVVTIVDGKIKSIETKG